MNTVNIHEAKTNLSKLVEKAAHGEPFIITEAGKPLVKVIALDTPAGRKIKRLGFMAGQIKVPEDFDIMFEQGDRGAVFRRQEIKLLVEGITLLTVDSRMAECPAPVRKI